VGLGAGAGQGGGVMRTVTYRDRPAPKGRTATQTDARMNKGERTYAALLDQRRAAGTVLAWWFELLSIRLADATHYHPDFLVMLADGTLELHEVKGRKRDGFYAEEDSWVKIKITAAQTPFPLRVVWPGKDGLWCERLL
jgi:hypothetical protein